LDRIKQNNGYYAVQGDTNLHPICHPF